MPAPFPPTDLTIDSKIFKLQSQADMELGKLIGAAQILPDTNLFLLMYVRREAVLSSQIEGTQASLTDILKYEALPQDEQRVDLKEVSNYITALRYGLERLKTLPLSLRLIREIHEQLMQGVRGGESHKTPGEFRQSQNWVGGTSPVTARYVPPPAAQVLSSLDELEKFFHDGSDLPILIKIALCHAYFETIHPFLDGNGRIGRLLVTFMLCEARVLSEPLLYLSIFFKENRDEYYSRLQAVRDNGDWEGWLSFFLEGVATVADGATRTACDIVNLREETRDRISPLLGRRSGNALQLLDHLFKNPYVIVNHVQAALEVSQPTANALVAALEKIGVLVEMTGRKRNRVFAFEDYLKLFHEREQRD